MCKYFPKQEGSGDKDTCIEHHDLYDWLLALISASPNDLSLIVWLMERPKDVQAKALSRPLQSSLQVGAASVCYLHLCIQQNIIAQVNFLS